MYFIEILYLSQGPAPTLPTEARHLALRMLSTCKKLSRWQIVFQQLKQQGQQMGKLQMSHWLTPSGRVLERLLATGQRTQVCIVAGSRRFASSQINSKIIVFVFVTLEFAACRKTFIRCLHSAANISVGSYKITSGSRPEKGVLWVRLLAKLVSVSSVSIERWKILIKILSIGPPKTNKSTLHSAHFQQVLIKCPGPQNTHIFGDYLSCKRCQDTQGAGQAPCAHSTRHQTKSTHTHTYIYIFYVPKCAKALQPFT